MVANTQISHPLWRRRNFLTLYRIHTLIDIIDFGISFVALAPYWISHYQDSSKQNLITSVHKIYKWRRLTDGKCVVLSRHQLAQVFDKIKGLDMGVSDIMDFVAATTVTDHQWRTCKQSINFKLRTSFSSLVKCCNS